MYKKTDKEVWLRVPVDMENLKNLNYMLKQQKKTLKIFINEMIKKTVDRGNTYN